MKRIFLTLIATILSVVSIYAQQIAVVNGAGTTTVFTSLDEAIAKAEAGSTVYLPGGGFQINDTTIINKKLTIMGIGHKANSENADGNTTISGYLQFAPGSDGSAVMGVYLSHNIKIGVGGIVKNILVRYCNVQEIEVNTDNCPGIVVNQNYIRGNVHFGYSNTHFSNNVVNAIENVTGGVIENNIATGEIYYRYDGYYSFGHINNSTVKNNVSYKGNSGSNTVWVNNYQDTGWGSVIVKWSGIHTDSDFHFNESYTGDTNVGIYGGTGFSDDCLPPMPYIVSKNIAEQTDAQGKLKIQVSVKTK